MSDEKESACIALLRKRMRDIDREKYAIEQGIKDNETYIADSKTKVAQLEAERIEVEDAIEALSFLKRGAA